MLVIPDVDCFINRSMGAPSASVKSQHIFIACVLFKLSKRPVTSPQNTLRPDVIPEDFIKCRKVFDFRFIVTAIVKPVRG